MAKLTKHKIKMQREVSVLKEVKRVCKDKQLGYPEIYKYESLPDFYYINMELLGPSLKEIRDNTCRKFSLRNIILIGI